MHFNLISFHSPLLFLFPLPFLHFIMLIAGTFLQGIRNLFPLINKHSKNPADYSESFFDFSSVMLLSLIPLQKPSIYNEFAKSTDFLLCGINVHLSKSLHKQQFGDREIPRHQLGALLHESCRVMLSETQRCEGEKKKKRVQRWGAAPWAVHPSLLV